MQRELAEEAGLAARNWAVLVDLFTTPGILGESLRIYLARDLRRSMLPTASPAKGARMDIVWASLDDLVDANSMAATTRPLSRAYRLPGSRGSGTAS